MTALHITLVFAVGVLSISFLRSRPSLCDPKSPELGLSQVILQARSCVPEFHDFLFGQIAVPLCEGVYNVEK